VLVSLAAFVLVLGVLIFVHELGHFLAAKWAGIGVPRFSIGFGPATPLKFRRGGTEYVVSWFPLGGYVKMASREEQEAMAALEGGAVEEEYPPEKLFENRPLAARMVVISAGVLMNVAFAWLVNSGLDAFVGRFEDATTALAAVEAGDLPPQAARLATVPNGTTVAAVNGDTITRWSQIQDAVINRGADRLRFDFAGGVDPVIVDIPRSALEDRIKIADALRPNWAPRVGGVRAGMPAEEAGLEAGDIVVGIDGDTVRSWWDLQQTIDASPGVPLALTVLRGSETRPSLVTPVETVVRDPVTGEQRTVGRIGIDADPPTTTVQYTLPQAVVSGAERTWDQATLVLYTLRGMLFGEISPRELGGPILIGQASGRLARLGGTALLAFMALLSVNLAILNLLPIPVLDGGHLVFLAVEGMLGKPLPLAMRLRLTQLGMLALTVLMVFVFANDILRLIG
jgi:regulator of sigma E protease